MGYVVTRFTASDNDLGPAGEFLFSMTQSVPDLDNGVTDATCNSICSYIILLFQVTYFAINEFSGDLSVIHALPLIESLRFQLVITAQASVINSLMYRSCLRKILVFIL